VKAKYARVCVVGVLAALIALVGLAGANPAGAQTQCPYPFNNCPTTTTSKHPQPVIVLELTAAVPGQIVRLTVCGYAPGTVVKITLNGVVVATIVVGNEPPKSCKGKGGVAMGGNDGGGGVVAAIGPVGRLLSGNVHAQTQTVSGGEGQFTVPSDLPQGRYLVCAEAPGEDSACSSLSVAKAQGLLLSSGNGESFLAFTGAGLARLLALAFGLIAVGMLLVVEDLRATNAR
jgi:hypothetical protein